ncbi:hypothetical protein HWV23_02745 [Natronomonas halophila]|uniref:hypothetical protein n=1 Tax=Natronomonas halophila TaxID=2747817 RepID=UPI0015B42778|nr:hypothetical protein [Natronomonas halophila]QLD84620.1 hypothetical protein HWV23_02470 [Natronomonas halophila]QLD84674.1 hypothetical protein HWV23_02745 [Natronomonas halophila]
MADAKKLAGVMVAVTIAAVLFSPIATTIGDNTGTQAVDNETVTASHGEYVDLRGYDIQTDSETVYYTNDTSGEWEEATPGTDYEMDYPPGSIQTLSSGSIDDGEEIRVSYDYQATDGTTTTVITMVPMFVGLLILGTLAARVIDEM